jgi:hypothetical protein
VRIGEVVGGRFELERLAGEGGMGSVYRALDRLSGRPAAVKLLARVNDALLERFRREAALLARLDHPAIVRYLAHGAAESGEPFLAMEWLEGEDLGARLLRGPLGIVDAVAVATRIAGALAHAHRAGVVHRDVKPANLFLVASDVAQAALLDFGIARGPAGGLHTRTGFALGTPGYMSPEQAKGERTVDARTDVFALGAVLYECLTGKQAFAGEHLVAVLAKVLLEDAPRISASAAVPESLDDLVASMLSKHPDERPRDGQAVVAALERLGSSEIRRMSVVPSAPALGLAERRVLSVAFARAPADLDPFGATLAEGEMDRTRRDLAAAFAAFGGTAELLANGALVAVWMGDGAATDNAARAARGVLAVAAAVPSASLALATGRATASGSLAMGEVIDRAARLVGATRADGGESAAAGPPRIDEATAALIEARFEIAKGASGLSLVREREAQASARTLLGKPTSFVGRERELNLLMRALEDAIHEPASRAICVTAPPGAGKSRLGHELVRGARERGAEVLVAAAEALASGSAFAIAGRLVRAAAGLYENEPDRSRTLKLSSRVSRVVPGADARRVAEFLGEIAGARAPAAEASAELRAARQDARTMGDQMRRAWIEWIAAEAYAHPLVLVLEDLHWGDAPSVELIDAALDDLAESPLLVLALARPEIDEALPRVFKRRGAERIDLRPLAKRAA